MAAVAAKAKAKGGAGPPQAGAGPPADTETAPAHVRVLPGWVKQLTDLAKATFVKTPNSALDPLFKKTGTFTHTVPIWAQWKEKG